MFSDAFPTFSPPPTSAGTTTTRPRFVEGTVYQLAKVLYELHVEQEAQPAIAIQEALMTFGHDPDRNPIVQAARSSAEALNRKRILLFNTTKSHPTTSIFEQAEISKKHLIANLGSKLEKMYQQNTQQGEEEGSEEVNWADYEEMHEKRTLLKIQLQNADYSEEEIKQSTERLHKIKEIDSRGNNESEDTVSQMKIIWKQLVQALLLQKSKSQDAPLVTFANTLTASKDPIGKISRAACSKLNRLVLEEGEDVRAFSARCRAEELYCSWLRALHAPNSSSGQVDTVSKHIDEDIDENLFTVLASALPLSLAYMRANIERDSQYGSKFQALRLAIEGEADFLREHSPQASNVSFLDSSRVHPNGTPTSEKRTESYQKIWNRVLALEASQYPPTSRNRSQSRSRSPRRYSHSSAADQLSTSPHHNTPKVCEAMFKRSICSDYECRLYHGVSNRDPSVGMCKHTDLRRWCPHLWSSQGCIFHHGQ
jgi:hypothetical protein